MNFYVYQIVATHAPEEIAQFKNRWNADEFIEALKAKSYGGALFIVTGGPMVIYAYGTKESN